MRFQKSRKTVEYIKYTNTLGKEIIAHAELVVSWVTENEPLMIFLVCVQAYMKKQYSVSAPFDSLETLNVEIKPP